MCQSTITRYVWSGDQILWELRAPGAEGDNLEATNGSAAPSNHAIRFGRVSYLHAGGIDRPLTITKDAQEPIIPHQNWRGTFAWGTWGKGTSKGYRSDCVSGGPSTCVNVAWPGWQTNAWHVGGNPGEQEYWMGSLADGMRDMSGQIYMRNRYYDPATGQIDRPLTITKDAQEPIIPHQNWRGTFAWGTWGKGTYKGYRSDCLPGVPPTNCVNVAWPGWQTNAWHVGGNPGEQEYWTGSLADGMRDMSGQIYMRNRYYDPATGQFTQQDPIGLAGGLNAYGFAAGDPVTYSDPYVSKPGRLCGSTRKRSGRFSNQSSSAACGVL